MIFLSLLFVQSLWAENLVFEEQVVVHSPIEEVYAFAADAQNDAKWRTEVHQVLSNQGFQEGSLYIEDAFLGIHKNYITITQIQVVQKNKYVVYETVPSNPFWLKSERIFRKEGPFTTHMTYKVSVEPGMTHDIWGFKIPSYVAEQGYRFLMRRYLKNLKQHFEDKPAS